MQAERGSRIGTAVEWQVGEALSADGTRPVTRWPSIARQRFSNGPGYRNSFGSTSTSCFLNTGIVCAPGSSKYPCGIPAVFNRVVNAFAPP